MTKETLVNILLKQHRNELVLEICRQDNISESFLNFVVQSFVEIGYGEFAEKAAKLRGKPLTDTEIKKIIDGYIKRGRTQEAVNIARLRPSGKLTPEEIDQLAENLFFKIKATSWAHSMMLDSEQSACLKLSPSKTFLEKLFTEIIEKKWRYDLAKIASTGKISPELIEKGIKFLFDNYDSNGDYQIEELVKYRPSKKLTLAEIELLAEKEEELKKNRGY